MQTLLGFSARLKSILFTKKIRSQSGFWESIPACSSADCQAVGSSSVIGLNKVPRVAVHALLFLFPASLSRALPSFLQKMFTDLHIVICSCSQYLKPVASSFPHRTYLLVFYHVHCSMLAHLLGSHLSETSMAKAVHSSLLSSCGFWALMSNLPYQQAGY